MINKIIMVPMSESGVMDLSGSHIIRDLSGNWIAQKINWLQLGDGKYCEEDWQLTVKVEYDV